MSVAKPKRNVIGVPQNTRNKVHTCYSCHRTFVCNGAERGCDCDTPTGPCCSAYPTNDGCWKGQLYYEKWKEGKYLE